MSIENKKIVSWGGDGAFLTPQIIGGKKLRQELLKHLILRIGNVDARIAEYLAQKMTKEFYLDTDSPDRIA